MNRPNRPLVYWSYWWSVWGRKICKFSNFSFFMEKQHRFQHMQFFFILVIVYNVIETMYGKYCVFFLPTPKNRKIGNWLPINYRLHFAEQWVFNKQKITIKREKKKWWETMMRENIPITDFWCSCKQKKKLFRFFFQTNQNMLIGITLIRLVLCKEKELFASFELLSSDGITIPKPNRFRSKVFNINGFFSFIFHKRKQKEPKECVCL